MYERIALACVCDSGACMRAYMCDELGPTWTYHHQGGGGHSPPQTCVLNIQV